MRQLRKDQQAIVFELLIGAAMAVVIFFALMNIGTFINGTISESLEDTLPAAAVNRSALQNDTAANLATISQGFDDNIDIMVIAAIITVITVPLAAVISIKRLM
jgi:hypothetical protein